MKTMKLLITGLIALSTLNAVAGTGDIGSGEVTQTLADCNSVSTDLVLKQKGNQLILEVTGSEGTTRFLSREIKAGEQLNPKQFTTYVISRVVDSHNVFGEGDMLSVNGNEGLWASGGFITYLQCR